MGDLSQIYQGMSRKGIPNDRKKQSGFVLEGRSALAVSNNQFAMVVKNIHCLSKLFALSIIQGRIVAKPRQQ